ncbi:YlzJ-like family protein [Desulforamulus ruminis]|uniref:YlzJ-like protein n=1 Tax=Desulforamulus ruminis (strain ATCC 23193 / DSM 2154 / NCIMB 8452 / DL) TaxID=696281 RepID=F6DUP4_DESRL|nr:YlzJ-like family protein [Desulforamulus ruminis]AEG60182.1 hypothetical protein Desru_1923 [Desulforamulus ruminis DSM 2154]
MILWTVLPVEQVMEGFADDAYNRYETGEVAGIPVLFEKMDTGLKKIVRINSSDPAHYLNQKVFPGLITSGL